ncbi:hypothetical protein SAMN04489761_0378 [Tenacibaculum sp. MAR_2009_124]|uniref:hypothetical protein n=1 Tax=Tenacibaculum sp. MAR_2009_124 TaxID=1250059 RepID=UPI000897EBDA|nr:hypothetical protein [Tenacibaculum sp. MAR_2009_124]SEB38998.1 hypothetical protein SAMN04489761_0378 [Tenacibaculum sp. MAR_2009_124]
MKSKILTIAMMGVSMAISAQEKTYTGIELNGANPSPSVNGFVNKIQFTGASHGSIVFNPGKTNELMFGFHSNKRFYWGTGRSASKPNFYSMILHGETGNLYLPGNIGIGISSPNESLTISKSGASLGIYDTNPLSKANNRIARYGNSLVIQNDLSGSWTDNINFHDTGRVGIGTHNPTEAKLVIKSSTLPSLSGNKTGAIAVVGYNTELAIGASSELNGGSWIQTRHSSTTYPNHAYTLALNPLGGKVGIGTSDVPTDFKFAVVGKMITEEVKVQLKNDWPDFVFENTYQLPTLKEVENHINKKGHLKDIPNTEEVRKNGFYLGEMDSKLLQKIEELTLYTIQQEKKIENLEKENTQLKTINEQLLDIQNRLKSLEQKN